MTFSKSRVFISWIYPLHCLQIWGGLGSPCQQWAEKSQGGKRKMPSCRSTFGQLSGVTWMTLGSHFTSLSLCAVITITACFLCTHWDNNHSRRSLVPQLTCAWKVTTINTTTTTTETQWYFQARTMFSVGTPVPPLAHVPEGLAVPGGAPDLSSPGDSWRCR